MGQLRLQVLREIIRMEMPDRLTDVTYPRHDKSTSNPARSRADITATVDITIGGVTEKISRPALNKQYFRQIYDMNATDGSLLISEDFAPAELLYLMVMSDPEAREQFQETEIGDNDEDGFFEFVDGWGRPIMFLRWAPGFRSDLQTGDEKNDHDPFDWRGVDAAAFRLVPLIYSGGADKKFGSISMTTGCSKARTSSTTGQSALRSMRATTSTSAITTTSTITSSRRTDERF
jgi:hypothetical protein